ncbi:hypothetical protein [Companilactobacillus sp. HBUAS59699]|uniref:hypothetical protein n=1 Tax=Companilactobacillus sp. HBUAS59699 TaxID=3109358 RepID=UPI002FF14AA8
MLQIKLVPYRDQTDLEDTEYIFTENLNTTIQQLEKRNHKVIDVDFFKTEEVSYAAIKYKTPNNRKEQ